ncbi:hypothetical protein B0T21DRAFT_267045, partial [Apiosordaria backusii]
LPPFLSADRMYDDDDLVTCGWKNFLSPKLRRFPGDTKFDVQEILSVGGGGGFIQVTFGDDATEYALKVREARTAAVLEKVQVGLRRAGHPISVPSCQITRRDMLRRLYAFSNEGRDTKVFGNLPTKQRLAPVFPTRTQKCFGWLRIPGNRLIMYNKQIDSMNQAVQQGSPGLEPFKADQYYFSIVYEHIPQAPLQTKPVQHQLSFFNSIGFMFC